MRASLMLFGGVVIRANAAEAVSLLEICRRRGMDLYDFHYLEDGAIIFLCSASQGRGLLKECAQRDVHATLLRRVGLPCLFYRYRKRFGMILGTLAAVVLFVLSQKFVWDVRVTGNERMTDAEVLCELESIGLRVGSYLPSLDARQIENRLLMQSESLAWVSVRLDGTVAEVQVREAVKEEPRLPCGRPANLVASSDGQIAQISVYRGKTVVSVGQAIKKGELLVSGVYDSNTQGYRYTRAAGSVFARTEREFCVEIPLAYTKKVYLDEKSGDVSLNFFGFSIKILKSTGNAGGSCDIIKVEKCFFTPKGASLPVWFTVDAVRPYREEDAIRTHEEALELAYAELDRRLSTLSDEALLLQKSIFTTLTQESVILTCRIECIEDIATVAEFEVTE